MTAPTVLFVTESPKALFIGSSRAYSIDFTDQGTPDSAGTSALYDKDGQDASAQLSGTPSLSGNVATTEKFTPTTEGTYRLVHTVTISGQTALGVVDIAVHPVAPPSAAAKTPATGTYSSLTEIAALVPRYANRSGTFDDSTRPPVEEVVTLIDQVSAILDSILATEGFAVPVTDTEAKRTIDFWVRQEIAAVVEGINGSGRFGPTTKSGGGRGRFALIFDDVVNWVEMMAVGLERMGAERTYDFASSIGYRDTDESGDEIFPIRQRKEFGTDWDNWDS